MTNNIVNCCENVGSKGDENYNNNEINNDNNLIKNNLLEQCLSLNNNDKCNDDNDNNEENIENNDSSFSTPPPSSLFMNNDKSLTDNNDKIINLSNGIDHNNQNYNFNIDDHHQQQQRYNNNNRKESNVSRILSAIKNQSSTSSSSHSSSSSSSSSSSTTSCCSPPLTPTSNNGDNSIWHIIHMILVVIASATINGVVFGVVNNFGVFYAYLTELSKKDITALGFSNGEEQQQQFILNNNNDSVMINHNSTTTTTTSDAVVQSIIAGVGSFNVGLIFFCSIFASVLSDQYSIRMICFIGGVLATIGMFTSSLSLNLIYLYVTYGLVLGVGASLVYGPSLAILGHYFTKRLGLVNGLVTAGSSAFSIIMPILLRWLLDLVGIQVTFKYLSILMGSLIICSLTFKEKIKRPSRQNGSTKKNLANMFFYDALWKNNLYLYWVISIPMGLFGYFVPFCHLVKHARDINSIYQGEVLVMSIGITSMIGRLITGPLADVSKINRICLQQIAFASIGFLTMLLPFVRDFPLLLVCCGLGIFDGTFISLLGPIAFDLVGPEYANQAIGLLLCFCSLPLTTGPPIAAYAYGIYGNYKLAFCLAGIPPIFAALLMLNIIRMQRIQRRRTSTIKLGIDEPKAIFDDIMIVNHHNSNGHIGNNNNNNNKLMINGCMNGEKLHLLINVQGGQDNHHHHHHHHHYHHHHYNNNNDNNINEKINNNQTNINGTTELKLSNNGNLSLDNDDSDNNGGNEKTILLNNNDDSNNIIILSKDNHCQSSSSSPSNSSALQQPSSSIKINANNKSLSSSRKSSLKI